MNPEADELSAVHPLRFRNLRHSFANRHVQQAMLLSEGKTACE
jgi:hypothetical protein